MFEVDNFLETPVCCPFLMQVGFGNKSNVFSEPLTSAVHVEIAGKIIMTMALRSGLYVGIYE